MAFYEHIEQSKFIGIMNEILLSYVDGKDMSDSFVTKAWVMIDQYLTSYVGQF